MLVNEKNKKLYESAFIGNEEYKLPILAWKPDIDERNIEESCEGPDGKWIPATPLGYRDYTESRIDGLNRLLAGKPDVDLSNDQLHHVKRSDNRLKKYDVIHIENGDFVVTGDTETQFFLADGGDHRYYVNYEKETITVVINNKEYVFEPKLLPGQKIFFAVATWEDDNSYKIVEDQVLNYDIEFTPTGEPFLQYMCLHSRNRVKEDEAFASSQDVWQQYKYDYPDKKYKE